MQARGMHEGQAQGWARCWWGLSGTAHPEDGPGGPGSHLVPLVVVRPWALDGAFQQSSWPPRSQPRSTRCEMGLSKEGSRGRERCRWGLWGGGVSGRDMSQALTVEKG